MAVPDLLEFLVLALTVVFIVRWRRLGLLASIPFGWLSLCLILKIFPRPEDWEAREDWPAFGWLPMTLWSLLVYGVVTVGARLTKLASRVSRTGCSGAPCHREWLPRMAVLPPGNHDSVCLITGTGSLRPDCS